MGSLVNSHQLCACVHVCIHTHNSEIETYIYICTDICVNECACIKVKDKDCFTKKALNDERPANLNPQPLNFLVALCVTE